MHIVRNSLPCGLGCSGGRLSETLPFTPVWLLLLNLHPRFNFAFGRPCSSGLLLPTAAGDKRRMEIKGMVAISKAVYLIYCKSHTVCRLQLSNMNMQIQASGFCAEVKCKRSVFCAPDLSQGWYKSGLETKSDFNLKQKAKNNHKFLCINCRTSKVFQIVWINNIQPMRKLFCSPQPRNVS